MQRRLKRRCTILWHVSVYVRSETYPLLSLKGDAHNWAPVSD
jgi:hypothetical protein